MAVASIILTIWTGGLSLTLMALVEVAHMLWGDKLGDDWGKIVAVVIAVVSLGKSLATSIQLFKSGINAGWPRT